MCARKMHSDEVVIDIDLVRRLLDAQFPQWASLPLRPVKSAGTDNAIYRLGGEMSVRLPRIERATLQIEKEHTWLPRFAPRLPLEVPIPRAKGEPGGGFPWQWSIYPWLRGATATAGRIGDLSRAARSLASFITALQAIDPTGGPPPGEHNFNRGEPLARRDSSTRKAIQDVAHAGMFDADELTAAWDAAVHAKPWERDPVWIHGDLSAGNLLAVNHRLTAVIDFGGLGVGDPACDLMVAWALFPGESREAFRTALDVHDSTWMRARGWALTTALVFIPYYVDTNPVGVRNARQTVAEVLADRASG